MDNLFLTFTAYLVFILLTISVALCLYCLYFKTRVSRAVLLSLSVTLTIVLYTSFYFIMRLCGIPISICVIIIFLTAVSLTAFSVIRLLLKDVLGLRKMFSFSMGFLQGKKFFIYLMVLIYLILLSNYLFKNGYNPNGDLAVTNMFSTEVMWHLTIVNGLDYDILPKTLHFIETDVSAYHYFPNLFIHVFSKLSGIDDTFILFVYFFVPLMLITLSLNIFTVANILWDNFYIAFAVLFLSLFCYDLSALILWARGLIAENHLWFGSNIPDYLSVWSPLISFFQLYYNPSYLFSTALFFGAVVVMLMWLKEKKRAFFILSVVCWVFLFKAKITAFLIGMAGLVVYSLYHAFLRKNYAHLFLISSILLLSFPLYAISSGQKKNKVEFSHWYFPANFAERAHFISKDERKQLDHLILPDNTSAVIRFTAAFIVYFAGLFHFRLLGYIFVFRIRKMIMWIKEKDIHIFLIACIFSGTGAFIFFVNSLAKYDSHWFYSLIVFILNFYAVKLLYDWFSNNNRFIKAIVIISGFFILSTAGSFLVPVLQTQWVNTTIISKEEVEAYRFLKTISPESRVMSKYFDLLEPNDEKHQLIMALSGKKVVSEGINYVFESRGQDKQYLDRNKKIREDIRRFYSTADTDEAINILNQYQTEYVFLKQPDVLLFEFKNRFKEIFKNSQCTIIAKKPI